MNLTGSAADAALAQAVSAYVASRESEYETYWHYRKMQSNGGTSYDASFVVPVSDEEKQLYIDQLGDTAEVQAIVATLSVKRTDEYHALNLIYGVLGNTYYSDTHSGAKWSYTASDVYEPDFSASNVNSGADTITLPNGHIFRDKQAVVLVCGTGSTVTNLECSNPSDMTPKMYYIKIVGGTIKLAESLTDWTNNVYVDLGTASGSFQLSEVAAMAYGHKWTETQLRYSLTAGWLNRFLTRKPP